MRARTAGTGTSRWRCSPRPIWPCCAPTRLAPKGGRRRERDLVPLTVPEIRRLLWRLADAPGAASGAPSSVTATAGLIVDTITRRHYNTANRIGLDYVAMGGQTRWGQDPDQRVSASRS